jgi:hypothetical protein
MHDYSSHCRVRSFSFLAAKIKSICIGFVVTLSIICLTIALIGCGSGVVAERGVSVLVSPNILDFGDVFVGQTTYRDVTVANNSYVTVDISKISFSSPAFSVAGAERIPIHIPPGATQKVSIGFVPTAAIDYSGQITFADAASRPVVRLSTQGRARSSAQLAAQLSPNTDQLNFSSVTVNTSLTQSLTLTSTGTAPVIVHSAAITGAGFTLVGGTLPMTLNPSQSMTLQVRFSPTTTGPVSGKLIIDSDSSTGSTTTIALSGTSILARSTQLTASAGSLSFGNVTVNTSPVQALTLTSTGTAPVTVDSATVTGAGFTLVGGALPVTLNPSQSMTLQVRFSPTATGSTIGQLVVNSDSSKGSTMTIALSGTSIVAPSPQLTMSAGSLSFGSVTVNTSTTQTLTLTSTGTAPVTVSSATVTGAGFTLAGGTLPVTLNPSQSLTLQVRFTPAMTGSASGQLVIHSDSSTGSSAAVALSGTSILAPSPQLTVSAGDLSFGSVTVNTSTLQPLTLTSSGAAPVTVRSATVTGAGFTLIGGTLPVTLSPTQSITLQVQFRPTATSSVNGQLTINSDSSTGNITVVALRGTSTAAPSPQLTVSSGSVSFGNVTVNTSTTQSLTLTSTGTVPVTVDSAAISGVGFSLDAQSFPITLNPNQSITLSMRFSPVATGSVNGELTINSDSSTGSTAIIALDGTSVPILSPQLTVSVGSLSFGNVTVNTSTTQSLTLTSTGTAPVTVSSAEITGAGFTLVGGTLPVTLSPTQSITLQVQFRPTATSSVNGQLTINSDSSTGSTAVVSLSGTGILAPSPQLAVSAGGLSFGNVTVNTSTTRSLTLTSTGTAPVTVSSAEITGAGFTLVGGTLPVTLDPTQSIMLQVQFTPTTTGSANGRLTIISNSSTGSTTVVSLSGTGIAALNPELTVSAGNLNFGNVTVNTVATLALTLTSTGTSPVTVDSASISGSEFTFVGGSLPATLGPTQPVTLQVRFSPGTTGSASGELTITSNSISGSTSVIDLTGRAIAGNPQLTISADSLDFGSIAINTSTTKALTLTSTGTSPLTVTSVVVSGLEFALIGGSFPGTLNPTESLALQLRFLPATVGAKSGQITITSNSTSGSTAVVAMSGTGTGLSHEVDLSWDAPASSPVPVVGYNLYRSAGSGGAFRSINTSPLTSTGYIDSAVVSGAVYVYIVKSVSAGGIESSSSNQMTITIP